MADVAREATSAWRSLPFFEIQFPVTDEDRVSDRGEVAGAVHDDVVDERDVEKTPGADEPRREEPVFVRRPHVAGRVVVRGDEADGAAHDSGAEDVPRPDVDLVHGPLVDRHDVPNHSPALVARKGEEKLLHFPVAKRGEDRRRLVRFVDHGPVDVDGHGGPPFIHEFRFHCRVSRTALPLSAAVSLLFVDARMPLVDQYRSCLPKWRGWSSYCDCASRSRTARSSGV